MVDAVVRNPPEGRATDAAAQPAGRTASGPDRLAACIGGREALVAYRAHCSDALFAPPQSPDWIEAWARNCNPDIVCLTLAPHGGPRLAVCLEVVRDRLVRTARLVGGSHANGSFPALSGGPFPVLARTDLEGLAASVRAARPDVDLLSMERLAPQLEGVENPLHPLRSWDSPNPALAIDLTPGFEGVLARASGKRKRKKHRSQVRKFEAAGGFRRITATTREDVDRLLDAFFRLKSARLKAMGVADAFGDEKVRAFFRDLFGTATETTPRPDFLLQALEVGGIVRAVTGSSRTPASIVCDFAAIAEDDLAAASPGDFLFFENIREACDEGLAVFDFSVGDEGYKRQWCDLETWQFDVAVPLTAKGHVAVGLRRGLVAVKRSVKSNPRLWNAVKALRRRDGGKTAKAQDAED
ncbi:GNAT family N-acetyltransferase [Aquibium carbonis]|uniref:GNAT family N-acetyltransferase n=1 Tax=Aquibium carbonis TaxID=2495581 RepID=A0A3R9YUF1_9HYPH|nr:GNAT family N-acetyltransferase [Aquibium carbonis]RST87328.1 GNAT family N-acetyltransferase [Aquibium carbonis]